MEEEATDDMGPPSQPPNVEEAYRAEEPNQMEEDATQPSTQLMMDPRRLGEYDSDLSDEDAGDILCILHPASLSAIQCAANITEAAPEHTVSRAEMPIRIRGMDPGQEIISPDTMVLAEQGLVTRDLALRLSANLKDPLAGFTFGRNVERCDFVLVHADKNGAKRISNIHFRIWVTENGVLMCEDQSTNGTWVEGKLLRSKSKEPGETAKHTLTHGTLIKLQMIPGQNDDIQFVVRIPRREDVADDLYRKYLNEWFARLDEARCERQRQKMLAAKNGNGGAPDLFANQNNAMVVSSRSTISHRSREWMGGQKYNKLNVIGKGAFATVYLLTSKFSGEQFAAKEIEKRKFMKNGVIDAKIDQEMKIMECINHENIVQFIECVNAPEHLYIIMEYAPEGTLTGLIDEVGALSEEDTKVVAQQMLNALEYLHERGIAHRDIKPDNVLVRSRPPRIHVQLTDFGLSKKILPEDDTFLRTFCGTILYCAPEVYPEYLDYFTNQHGGIRDPVKSDKHAKRYDHAVDVWSLAGLLFYCLTKLPPYSADALTHHTDMLRKIMTGPLDVRPLQKMEVTELGISFLKSMLNNMPQLRATIEELLEHPWLIGEDSFVEGESIVEEETEIEIVNGVEYVNGRQVYRGMPGESFHLDTQMTDVGDLEHSTGSSGSNKADAENQENIDPLAESGLEQSASQLSIVEEADVDADVDFEDESSDTPDEVDLVHDTTTPNRAGRIEIPNSIESDSFVSFDQEFPPSKQTTPTAPRLFREVKSKKATALDTPLTELAKVRDPIIRNASNYVWHYPKPTLRHDKNRLAMSQKKENNDVNASTGDLSGGGSLSAASTSKNNVFESNDYTGDVARQLTGEFAEISAREHTAEHAAEFASDSSSINAESDSSVVANSSRVAQAGGTFASSDTFAGAGRALSLLGAESMVGDMAINSPGPASAGVSNDNLNINPSANASVMVPAVSLRRPRAVDEDDDEDNGRPAAKRHHSITLDLLVNGPRAPEPDTTGDDAVKYNGPLVPVSVFFDPKNKATHHLNYPKMTEKEYEGAVNLAAAQGENFMHGGKLFNMVMKMHQQANQTYSPSSSSSSFCSTNMGGGRAQSLPTTDTAAVSQGRHGMCESRDQLPFGGKFGGWVNGVPTPEIAKFFPSFANYYDEHGNVRNPPASSSQMAGADGFQAPKRILAKLVSTPDSAIPNLTITITENLTTWGRGFRNLIRYEIGKEDRIPKNALKLALWAPGMKPGDPVPATKDNEHAFYIATKATHGIKVNNVPVAANEPGEPQKVEPKYWGRLQNGDIIIAWASVQDRRSVVKFRFDCFWGASAKPRAAGDFFDIVEAGETREALNRYCQWEEARAMQIKFEKEMAEKAARDAKRAAGREGESEGMTPARGPSASSSRTDDGGRGLREPGNGVSFSQ